MPRTTNRWSARVVRTSDALDLESGVFRKRSARAIALSLKRPADHIADGWRALRTSCGNFMEGNLMPEKRTSERGRTTTEAVAKRRLRSLKRETGGGRKDVLAKRSKRKA